LKLGRHRAAAAWQGGDQQQAGQSPAEKRHAAIKGR
jgi:hypothetical protein